ncbi:XRE family transcriptional regulator [Solidesulfovibrio sp.]
MVWSFSDAGVVKVWSPSRLLSAGMSFFLHGGVCMAGRNSFAKLREAMSPESRERARGKAVALRQEMDLAELRNAMQLSQEELASSLHIGQASVAKMEKRTDMYVSTLRRFIEAMGGELDIVARFPDHAIHITTFSQIREDSSEKSTA